MTFRAPDPIAPRVAVETRRRRFQTSRPTLPVELRLLAVELPARLRPPMGAVVVHRSPFSQLAGVTVVTSSAPRPTATFGGGGEQVPPGGGTS